VKKKSGRLPNAVEEVHELSVDKMVCWFEEG
jgi:hypothetical protein